MRAPWLSTLILPLLSCPAPAGTIEELGEVTFLGAIHEAGDISAVAAAGDLLVIASDEGGRIQLLDRVTGQERTYRVRPDPIRPLEGDEEIDVEGLASDGDRVFAVGSHSLRRRLLEPEAGYDKNRKRLLGAEHEPGRDHLLRLTLDRKTGRVSGPIDDLDLRGMLTRDPLLEPFLRVPGKENGVDIEGIATDGKKLYLGLRSPVLRSGHSPVLVLSFDNPSSYELRFVDLDGLPLGDLTRVEGGFLLLAGPECGKDGSSSVFFWDGTDRVPGRDAPAGRFVRLGKIPSPAGGRAEGLTVVGRTTREWDVLVVHDGVPGGAPRIFRIPQPQAAPAPAR